MTPAPQERRRTGRFAWAAGALLLLLLALHTAIWFIVSERIRAGIPAFLSTASTAGWVIESGPSTRSGWPWTAGIALPNVVATRALGGTTLRWSAAAVTVSVAPADPGALAIVPIGEQSLNIGERRLPIQASQPTLRIPLDGATPITFAARDVAFGTTLRAGHLTGQLAPLAFGITAADIRLDPPLPAPFDGGFALTLGATATRPFPDAATPADSAAQWHAQGGRIAVSSLELRWGPLLLTGSGEGGLDARLQPVGRATLHVRGATEVLDAAARAGLVAPGPASAARAVFGLLTLAAPGGAMPLPVLVEDRTVTVAQFPLARLPMLEWNLP